MRVTLSVIADYASLSLDSKLQVLGIFDEIASENFPAQHPLLFLVVRLRAEPPDGGQEHRLRMSVVGPKDTDVSVDGKIRVRHLAAGEYQFSNHIVAIRNIVFPAEGIYYFRVEVDDEELAREPLRLSLAQPEA